ncbi:hypothetical protein HPP92_013552 [Vanilla planifolia]|uniref:Uncharacterized protein n=1 Tax=Vanilla planifolia TaxID=51239 RepID=A0A835R2M7_VANPL|nr:hypothetical protein HPP92_013552 [Vanilla planifolia]
MGHQMSSIASLDSYANNNGLCGIQIRVERESTGLIEASLGLGDDGEQEKTWLSWEAIMVRDRADDGVSTQAHYPEGGELCKVELKCPGDVIVMEVKKLQRIQVCIGHRHGKWTREMVA